MLDDENTTVSHLTLIELLHACLDTLNVHGELLDGWQDLVVGGELEHVAVDWAGGDEGSLDAELAGEERHVWKLEVVVGDGEWVDGSVGGHDRDELVPVWLEGGGDEEVVNTLANLEVLDTLGGVELVGSELHGLLSLGLGGGEDDNAASHLGGELDGQVTESSDTNNTDTVGWLDVVETEGRVDGGTTAHEWGSVLALDGGWDLEDVVGLPDTVVSEGTLVVVVVTEELTSRAEGVVAGQALVAVTAGVVKVSPSDGVSLLEAGDTGAELLNYTSTLVAETHVDALEVLIGTAESGVGDLDENIVALDLTGGGGLDNLALLGALVGNELNHIEDCGV